jgi:hypothetical protein
MAKPYADSTTAPIAQQPPPKTKQGAERQAELWLRWLANLHLEPRDMAAVTREAEHWRRQGQRCSPGQPWGQPMSITLWPRYRDRRSIHIIRSQRWATWILAAFLMIETVVSAVAVIKCNRPPSSVATLQRGRP